MSLPETAGMAIANMFPRTVDATLKAVASNHALRKIFTRITRKKLATLERLERILLVSDTNIGDAVVLQSALPTLKHYFPECDIDYLYQRKAAPLIRNNPLIRENYPVMVERDFTSSTNSSAMASIVKDNDYDLIINLYPFFSRGDLKLSSCPTLSPFNLVFEIIKSLALHSEPSHVKFQLNRYLNNLIRCMPEKIIPDVSPHVFSGNTLYLGNDAREKVDTIIEHLGIPSTAHIIFFNPDTSSPYTLIPLELQAEILQGLLRMYPHEYFIIGPGFTFKHIERKLYHSLPRTLLNDRVVMVSSNIAIDTYAGLIDRADLFITGDTAQMHIAAAYKECPGEEGMFRNRTALLNVFGATSAEIYGYDSFLAHYLDSSQQAPAKIFEGSPRCKNLTCIHKTRKKCPAVKCFRGLRAADILNYLQEFPLAREAHNGIATHIP